MHNSKSLDLRFYCPIGFSISLLNLLSSAIEGPIFSTLTYRLEKKYLLLQYLHGEQDVVCPFLKSLFRKYDTAQKINQSLNVPRCTLSLSENNQKILEHRESWQALPNRLHIPVCRTDMEER